MPLRICDEVFCRQPVDRNAGNCMICGRHLCCEHAGPAYHTCPREQDNADAYFEAYDASKALHLKTLIAKINFGALQTVASQLRNTACYLPSMTGGSIDQDLVTSQMGGQNLHVDVVFEDGVTWIARIRLDDPLLAPPMTRDSIVESEIATLNFLSGTQVPVPIVHHYTLSTTLDDVSVPYILMDKLAGKPLNWASLGAPEKSKVLSQLADIFIELSQHPCRQQGSLVLSKAQGPVIGGFAQTQLFTEPDVSLGPFSSTNVAAKTILDFYMDMYASGELTDFPVDTYLAHVYRKDLVDDLYPSSKPSNFFLKHFDDKGDHILVDGEANITGIIDWEYASTECEELAFSTPCMFWPVAQYYDGENELTDVEEEFSSLLEQKGYKRLAETVLNGRLHQRFWFFLGGGAAYDHKEFVSLFDGLRRAYAAYSDPDATIEPYEEWRKSALEKLKGVEPRLQQILRRERTVEQRHR